ncbi:hypothetical protein [Microbacterium istanbulense]|uniref:Uncharacterized protein n=1 Tax=Microbacterium istanbulense TaxID=3122049 RepID=A0ABU8LKV1_9MICO
MTTDDIRLNGTEREMRALIAESEHNRRTNPALEAERYRPTEWTPEMERELVERVHGDERARIDRLIAEHNEAQRHR